MKSQKTSLPAKKATISLRFLSSRWLFTEWQMTTFCVWSFLLRKVDGSLYGGSLLSE